MSNPYDQACRFLLRSFPLPLLSWMLRLPPGGLDFAGWLDTRGLPWPGSPDRTCDTVAHLRDPARGGLPWAVPVEFQIDPDPGMLGRGLGYLGGLREELRPTDLRGDRFEVGLVVVNLRGRGRCSRAMRLSGTRVRTALGAVEWNLSRFSVGKALRRIAAGRWPAALLPWLPLFDGAGEAGIIEEWGRLARMQAGPELRRVMPLALLFAEAVGRMGEWRDVLEGWDMIESQVVKEWTELALQKGLREGKSEGLRAGKVDAIMRVLRRPPLSLPADLERAVRAVDDLARLDAALDVALASPSLEEFRRTVGL